MSKVRNVYIWMVLLLVALFVLRIVLGSVFIPFDHLFELSETEKLIILKYRMPHAIVAVFVGVILSASGLIMQSVFRNPLAGPFVLGISSGASLMVALVLMTGLSGFFSGIGISLIATLGALGVVLLITLISLRFSDNFTLLIFGLMLGYVFSAVQGLTEYFGDAGSVKNFVVWGMGSFGNVNKSGMILLGLSAALTVFIGLKNSRKLDLYSTGDDYARLEGVNIKKLKLTLLLVVGLGAGIVTGYCGPIAFLGISVPHLARLVLKQKVHRTWFITTILSGALLALLCDVIAEVPFANVTFPINVVTSIIGAPVVIWVLLKKRRG